MDAAQTWLVVGIPALLLACALFYGRSRLRTRLGYVALLGAFAALTAVDRASGAVVGGIIALLYAAGRGGQMESETRNTSLVAMPDTVRNPVREKPANSA
jgi:hypothetical protein